MGRPPTSRVGNIDATSRMSCPIGCPTRRVNFVSEDKLCNTTPTVARIVRVNDSSQHSNVVFKG